MDNCRNHRSLVAFGLLALLSGCSRPEVESCEAYIKSGLKAPMSYRKISVRTFDSQPMHFADLRAEAGLTHPKVGSNALLHNNDMVVRRDVFIDYDADNDSGVPIRSIDKCVFKIVDGKAPTPSEMALAVSHAITARSSRELRETGLFETIPDHPAPTIGFECCLGQ